jgi:hypothetical protein
MITNITPTNIMYNFLLIYLIINVQPIQPDKSNDGKEESESEEEYSESEEEEEQPIKKPPKKQKGGRPSKKEKAAIEALEAERKLSSALEVRSTELELRLKGLEASINAKPVAAAPQANEATPICTPRPENVIPSISSVPVTSSEVRAANSVRYMELSSFADNISLAEHNARLTRENIILKNAMNPN